MKDIAFQIERDILKVGNQLNNMRDEDLKQRNMTPAQSETLLFFAEHEGATVSELKDYLKISHQAARKLAEKLREKKYVYASVSKEDARANAIFLTDEGKAISESLKQTGSTVGSILLHGFSQTEIIEFHRFLKRASANMKKTEG